MIWRNTPIPLNELRNNKEKPQMAAIEDLKPGGPQFYKISVFRKLAWQ